MGSIVKEYDYTDLFLNTFRNEKLSSFGLRPVGELGVETEVVNVSCNSGVWEVPVTGKENEGTFEDSIILFNGLQEMLVGRSGGIEALPIKLFNILEHAAFITPSFRDRKSLWPETNEIYPFCIFCLRLGIETFPAFLDDSWRNMPDCDLFKESARVLFELSNCFSWEGWWVRDLAEDVE